MNKVFWRKAMLVSISQLKTNPSKYVDLADKETVFITKNGKKVAKLIGAKADKISAAKELFGILPEDVSLDEARAGRLND